ncbi:hypothetical protein CQW23_30570 [Capsicum baccatum]|uniref:Uncharacterized protein n=1 Tax=Capsicum baccatum TaxID=33114 RepID=A0A2G2V9Y2_CAPBA|nr:hypothetical protein CQW23_30570 [Capsicum baccatum]
MGTVASPHFVIFPLMSHGHTIPLLHLATLLCRRFIAVTVFTTPANAPFIRDFLQDVSISIIELPFPKGVLGIPAGVENTEKLPSMSSFGQFANATKLMQALYCFFGMSVFANTLCQIIRIERPHSKTISPDEPSAVSSFPWLKLTRNDCPPPFGDLELKGPAVDFMKEQGMFAYHGN